MCRERESFEKLQLCFSAGPDGAVEKEVCGACPHPSDFRLYRARGFSSEVRRFHKTGEKEGLLLQHANVKIKTTQEERQSRAHKAAARGAERGDFEGAGRNPRVDIHVGCS